MALQVISIDRPLMVKTLRREIVRRTALGERPKERGLRF